MSCDYEALAARGVQGLSPYQPEIGRASCRERVYTKV